MPKYRPKKDSEGLVLDVMLPNTATGGDLLTISSWPREPESVEEERLLANHPLLTNQPERSSANAGASNDKKGDS
jgi:hypothetical protein